MSEELNDLLETVLPEDVLEREGLDYKTRHGSSGEQINMKECPFCGGNEWKVYLNRDSGLGNCFHGSCGKTFNAFSLYRAILGRQSVLDYLKRLARELGYRTRRNTTQRAVDTDVEWEMPDSLALPTDKGQTLTYLEQRGIDQDTAGRFHLRYCIDGWYRFIKQDGNQGGVPFGGRVLMPVFDLDGKLVTFQGRDITGEAERRYLFPPGLPGTGKFLYNGQNARYTRIAVMGEGPFDVMALDMAMHNRPEFDGYTAVGSFGMHLSTGPDGQLSRFMELKRLGLKEVRIAWDGERKAWIKAIEACRVLDKHGLIARIIQLEKGRDPAEMSVAPLRQAIHDAQVVNQKTAVTLRLRTPF